MQRNKGFTLVEMAIVLSIIGAIISVVVAGDAIIKNAKLRSVISDLDKYKMAVSQFKEKFHFYPGDFKFATNYFGTKNRGNGDGNWRITGDDTEILYTWQHLYLAGFIDSNLSGFSDGSPIFKPGINVPSSKIQNNYFLIRSDVILSKDGTFIEYTKNSTNNQPYAGSFTPEDASYIDEKLDDKIASSGNIYAIEGKDSALNSCTTSENLSDLNKVKEYNLINKATDCRLVMWLN